MPPQWNRLEIARQEHTHREREKHSQQSADKIYSIQRPAYPHIAVTGNIKMANSAKAVPDNAVSTANALLDKRRMNKA